MKNFFKAFGFLLLCALIYLVVNVGVTFGFSLGAMIKDMGSAEATSWMDAEAVTTKIMAYALPITIIANLLTLGLLYLIFLARKDKFTTYVNFKKVKGSDLALTMALGLFLNLLIGPVLEVAMKYIPATMLEQYFELMETIVGGSFILVIITTSIMAPLFEEIVVRGIIFNDFKKALPLWIAIIVQGLVFGLMHMNWIQGTYAFVIGVIFGIVYHRYKSIWVPIGMHFAFNTTSIILEGILGEASSPFISVVMLVVGIAGGAVTLYFMKKNYVAKDYEVLEQESVATLEGRQEELPIS